MERTNSHFSNYACVQLENETLQLWVTKNVGPRIIGLRLHGGDNLFAVRPEMQVTTPGGMTYSFRGGHRLWYAPEDLERTYLPDDSAVTITEVPNGIQTTQPVEAGTGIEKRMIITLPDETPRVVVEHVLVNAGGETVELAPWAITQFKTGGFAILPQNKQDTGLLPNRRMAIWPYTKIDSPHLQLGDEFVFVHAEMRNERFKIGWANSAGWLAYWVDNTLFVKQAAYVDGADYYDFGSSSECYCDDYFLELETLAPRTMLGPGESVTHREVWRVYSDVRLEADETAVRETLNRIGIFGFAR